MAENVETVLVQRHLLQPNRCKIHMPAGARVLSVHHIGHNLVLFALVDLSKPMEDRDFITVKTAEIMTLHGTALLYIGTIITDEFKHEWHVFEVVTQLAELIRSIVG